MDNDATIKLGIRLKLLRKEHGYTLDSVCKLYNIKFNGNLNKGTLSRYENSTQEPLFTTVINLSELYNVTYEYLFCKSNKGYTNIIPILSTIVHESSIVLEKYIEGYECTSDKDIDYCFKIEGSSMIGARIYDGDIVFVSKYSTIENGDIVVALVDGENATLKKYYKFGGKVILKPENPTMKELVFNAKDKNFKLLGKVKSVKFNL